MNEEKQYKDFVLTEEFLKAQEELAKNLFNRMMQEGIGTLGLPSVDLFKYDDIESENNNNLKQQ